MINAVLAQSRKYAVCGACGRSLCRRDRMEGARLDGTVGPFQSLQWDADWRLVDGHIERGTSAIHRIARGNAPVRGNVIPHTAGKKQAISFPNFPPALCPWAACGAMNRMDPKKLDVTE